ncbi:permease prefix domain 1-containing protein [Agromyces sp. LHK192]|uniref:permease prefix domain 1-containing protein n=1 Tax=Agromyces sp. LHK192 TaxID=2498704 RepID=UPI000FDCC3B5|nr:permease prefix domain 1-containing protein [Agromyces sp. LHK192]
MSNPQPARRGGDIHRLLDEAFSGVALTPDLQDLKEELRDGLLSRAAEIEAQGVAPAAAARRAFDELGDIDELITETDASAAAPGIASDVATSAPGSGSARGAGAARESASAAALRNRVRPKPGFVVRTVVLSIAALAVLALLLIGLTPLLDLATGVLIGLGVGFGALLGFVTGDALRQETTTHHRMPAGRAWSYGAATGLLLAGLTIAPVVFLRLDLGWITLPAVAVVAAIAVLSYLGATQTNRLKPWALRQQQEATPTNRFEEHPEVAARFGIYTAAIWTVAFISVPIVGFTAGWMWAAIPVVAGFVLMLIVLARMLFGGSRDDR